MVELREPALDPDLSGRHEVTEAEVDCWAESDGRPVPVLVRHPTQAGAGPLPVVVFSHGLRGSRRHYAAISHRLARHGYAVLHPEFLDSPALGGDATGAAALFDPAHWASRVSRVHAILDTLSTQDHLSVHLDPTRVMVAGHSFGAFTTQLLLGTELRLDHELDTSRFARPDLLGGVLLSPQGSGDRGLGPDSWRRLDRPVLVVTGTDDLGPHGEGLAWRRELYDAAPAVLKHLAIARDADHHLGGTTDAASSSAPGPRPELRHAIAALVTAFARLLDGDRDSGAWLARGPFPTLFHHEHRDDREDRHE